MRLSREAVQEQMTYRRLLAALFVVAVGVGAVLTGTDVNISFNDEQVNISTPEEDVNDSSNQTVDKVVPPEKPGNVSQPVNNSTT